ncbi:MAG: type II secretion system F family protein [Thermodesulfovibrionales bacterium]|nr:type II secretion system F family protein [Thermodesulfovibrionales bacterium]
MPFFSYRAIDGSGALVKGIVETTNMDVAYDSIASAGLHVIDIKKSNEYIVSIKRRVLAKKIKRRDIIEFASNLSVMLKSGIPLLSALSDIAETTENRYFKQKIDSIRSTVELGSRFSDAVAVQKHIFPDIFVRLVMVGEETGRLDKGLSDVAGHLQRMEDLAASIKRALIYPAFAIVTTTGALLFWLIYVLPKVITVFKDMGIVLPLPTRILISISNFTQSYWYLILLSPVILFVLIKVLRQKKETRYYIDLAKIKFPVMKHVIYNKLLALFSEQLRILTTAGITIDRSFEITADVIGNDVFKSAIEDSKQAISGGSRISDALRKHEVFPPLATRMIDIGETSGTLDEQFAYLSEYYLKRLDDVSQKLGKMIEPIVISVIGLMFALIIIGLLFPVYELVSKMGR